ncbi:MFS transporter [Mycolicibacterium sp. P9-64]|uniref:MFS transporter n=1 Tax=Mycolicibacterium sp. P9-64 TaxID=2024612 RepID=UPI0011EF747A|nr:MFS transporter [Mycolicibacterium sp. P9-64]KAA0074199.1 MFS transporter [Mycolicibacterium sp. P9-64]
MAPGRLDDVPAATRDRRARVATAALFLTNGAIYANMLPRFPEIKTDLGLSNATYGAAVAAFSAGALVSGLTAGALIRRFNSSRIAVIATLGIAMFVFVAAIAPSPVLFAAALFVGGAADSVTDVAQNAHGLRVQRNYGRSIINSLHAVWSVGAISGGLMGAAAIALHVPRGVHLAFSGVLFSAVVLIAYPFLLRGPDHDDHPAAGTADGAKIGLGVYGVLAALVGIAIAGAAIEDAGSSWATVYLRDSLHTPAAIAAFGYIALVSFQFIGRFFGDRLVDRFGERSVARVGGLIAAAGMGAALAFPSLPATIAGFAAAGFGSATLIPAAMHGADRVKGLRPGTGLTIVTWLCRVGFLMSPIIVGVVADATSVRIGLLIVPVAGLAAMALTGVLSAPHRSSRWSARRQR